MFNELRRICGDVDLNCHGLGIRDFHNPVSITQGEFDYITQFIQTHNLKSGFECATAFGVSACAAGLGFQKTGGHLITMDCYIEEITKNCAAYNIDTSRSTTNTDPIGLRICKQLLAGLNLDCVTPLIGVSPDDIPAGQYDYVFIDAEHTDEAVRRDLIGVKPYLAEKFVVFIHDWHCFHDLSNFIYDNFGCGVATNVANSPYNLSLFTNLN